MKIVATQEDSRSTLGIARVTDVRVKRSRNILVGLVLLEIVAPILVDCQTRPPGVCRGCVSPYEVISATDAKRAVPSAETLWSADVPCGSGDELASLGVLVGGRVLVVYAAGPPQLLDSASGEVLWTVDPTQQCDASRREKADSVSFVGAVGNLVLLRTDKAGRTSIVAVSEGGKREWVASWETPVQPRVAADFEKKQVRVLTSVANEQRATAINMLDGTVGWFRKCERSSGALSLIADTSEFALIQCGGIEAIDKSGRTIWKIDVVPDPEGPAPRIDGQYLYILSKERRLTVHRLDSGASVATVDLNRSYAYQNIVPADGRVYMRGVANGAHNATSYFVMAVQIDGSSGWEYHSPVPAVSNIVEWGDRLYLGTSETLVGLDRVTGRVALSIGTSSVGKRFPVRLRRFDNEIVWIGELLVIAVDSASGKEIYRCGFDPLSQVENLDGVDAYMTKLRKELSKYGAFGKRALGEGDPWYAKLLESGIAGTLAQQAGMLQESSDKFRVEYRRQSALGRSSGSTGERARQKADTAWTLMEMEQSAARDSQAAAAVWGLAESMGSAVSELTANDRARFRDLLRTRRFLSSLYALDEQSDYVWRPRRAKDGTIRLAYVHLPTGRRDEVALGMTLPGRDRLGPQCMIDPSGTRLYTQMVRAAPETDQDITLRALNRVKVGRYIAAVRLP